MDYAKFINVARGLEPADMVIKNVTMLMTTTNEWIQGDLAITGEKIAGAGAETYDGKTMIDGTGLYAVPGFIDSHVHIESSNATPFIFEQMVLPLGTTTAICDPHELCNVCGKAAIRYFLDCAKLTTMDLRINLSSCVPATPLETAGAELSATDLVEFLNDPDVGGLAELMNVPGVLYQDKEVLAKIEAFKNRIIDGHAPLLAGRDLNAYIGCGVCNDHECSNPEEAIEKIRRGQTVFIREGTAAQNLNDLAPIISFATIDNVALCTDDRSVHDILREGHVDGMIRRLIKIGIAPELAYRTASLSSARHFRLYDRGMLAPGKLADIVLLSDKNTCRIHSVIKSGRLVGKLVTPDNAPDVRFALNSIHRKPLKAADFRITGRKKLTPVILVENGSIITGRADLELPTTADGEKLVDPQQDVAKLCVFARHGKNENVGRGFVKNFGMKRGAFASSIGHDSHNLCVIGMNDEDMALAVNTLIECGGGWTAVMDGKVLETVPFPIGGLMAVLSIEEIQRREAELEKAVRMTGCTLDAPFMQLAFLPLPVIPFLKLTDKGLVDVEKFDFIEL